MSLDEGLRLFLLSRPGVVEAVGERVYPEPLPQGATLPAVTYSDVSDVGSTSNDGPDCLRRPRYQLTHWARTREAARRVDATTRQVMSGFRGQWPGGLRIGGVFRRNGWTLYEPETQLYQAISDYQISAFGEE